tara:strand:- start:7765 stop:8445 length:681 start_codon:yes stop_codon:yes gene_type:complete
MDNDYFGLGTHEWIGIVLPYESQKDQSDGNAGFGYRFKVAMMGNHPNNNTIKDKDIVYALVRLGPTDGTGAGNRKKTPAISQGDVVTGKFLDGDRKQNPLITGVLGRPQGNKYGTQRFDSKTGFIGSTKAGTLLGRQEFSEQVPLCTPKAKSGTAKPKRKSPLAAMAKAGLPTGMPTIGGFAQPLAQAAGLLNDTLEVMDTSVGDIVNQVTDTSVGDIVDQLIDQA